MVVVFNMNSSYTLVTTAPMFAIIQILLLSTNSERTVKRLKRDISYIEK